MIFLHLKASPYRYRSLRFNCLTLRVPVCPFRARMLCTFPPTWVVEMDLQKYIARHPWAADCCPRFVGQVYGLLGYGNK